MTLDWYRKRPLFWWAIFFSLGIIIQYYHPVAFFILAMGIGLLGIVSLLTKSDDRLLIVLILLLVTGYGMFRLVQTRPSPNNLIRELAEMEYKVMYSGTDRKSTRLNSSHYS